MPCKSLQSWVRQNTIKSPVNYYCSKNHHSTIGIKSHRKIAEAERAWFLAWRMGVQDVQRPFSCHLATFLLMQPCRLSSYPGCSTEISKRTAWTVDQKAADATCAPLLRSTAFSGQQCFKKLPRLHSDDHSALSSLPNSCQKK